MKFMKLGTCLDTFYTEEAIRMVISDVPSDFTIRINGISYLLHQYYLLPKCGLLQRLVSPKDDSTNVTLDLHDIPGGNESFELCAKFCYGITINLSAHNFVSAFCAAKFLRMTEAVQNGNFIKKLEAFFSSCILEGWKDSIVTLENTEKVYEWSENLGVVRRCMESIVDKILTPPEKVAWSYTYTRPGYNNKRRQPAPKDWWTEDISFLGIDAFKSIITAIKATNIMQPQLIGEALHVYACRWLLDIERRPHESSTTSPNTKQRILEMIVSLIPTEKGSVSVKFLIKLLRITKLLEVPHVAKAELVRLSALQLDEATLDDLVYATRSSDGRDQLSHDVELVRIVLQSFLRQWRRRANSAGERELWLRSISKVGKMTDLYLQVVAKDVHLSVQKVICLVESLPGIARPQHDDLYKAINIYLKEHPDLSKTDKKELCRVLDFQKLSPEVRADAVKNEHLPLRTVVQILFIEQQEKNSAKTNEKHLSSEQLESHQQTSVIGDDMSKLKISAEKQLSKARKGNNRLSEPGTSGGPKCQIRKFGGQEMEKESEIREEGVAGIQLRPRSRAQVRRLSEKTYDKGRQR